MPPYANNSPSSKNKHKTTRTDKISASKMVRRTEPVSTAVAAEQLKTINIVDPKEDFGGQQSSFGCGITKLFKNVESDLDYLMGRSTKREEDTTTTDDREGAEDDTVLAVISPSNQSAATKSILRKPKYSEEKAIQPASDRFNERESPPRDAVVSSKKLSMQLCKLADPSTYSRHDALATLDHLFDYAQTECPYFMKYFDRYAGIVHVVDFLNDLLNDKKCDADTLIESIKKVSIVIKSVVYSGSTGANKEVAKRIASSFVKCDGINILKRASDQYHGGSEATELWAVQSVWGVLRNITCKPDVVRNVIEEEQAIDLLDCGINVVVELKSVEGREASSTLEDAFITMSNVVSNDYVTVQHIQEKDIIRHCLEPFTKEDGSFTFRSEVVTNKAINFFNWCHNKSLLEESNGEKIYENMLLPFFVQALKRYPSNEKIQINAFNFLEYTCTVIDDKSKIEAAGAMEVLSSMLIAPDIHAEKKKRIRRLIIAITA